MPSTPQTTPAPPASKSERTRAHLEATALRLFREQGEKGVTMRALAKEAGVAVGSAYYHFPSKDHLVQVFYAALHRDHLAVVEPLLERETKLEDRLLGVIRAKFDTAADYHAFSACLFKSAADPRSPLSPFSEESAPVREDCQALMGRVLEGTRLRKRSALQAELPELLWLYLMGLILFWVHDRSHGQGRSYRLAERTVPIVCRLIRLADNPLLTPVVKPALRLLAELKGPLPGEKAQDPAPETSS